MTRNVELLVRAARAFGDLRDEVVFVGGAVIDLFITDPAAPHPRFTEDVDVVVEVTTHGEWARIGERLRAPHRRQTTPLATAHMTTRPPERLRGRRSRRLARANERRASPARLPRLYGTMQPRIHV